MSSKIYKPRPLSGFPEWSPGFRALELKWLDLIRTKFELYGFCNIETPAVEEVEVLSAKGEEIDKEIYALRRLRENPEEDKDARFALHYDLTVPLARYVAQRFSELVFPFKRYQIQKVWRGERPQEGRYREFYQADIDVIGVDNLSLHFDAEMPLIAAEVLREMNIGDFEVRISNRKILQGFISSFGIENPQPIVRVVDKLDKIGLKGVETTLRNEGHKDELIKKLVELASICTTDISFSRKVKELGIKNALLDEGLSELEHIANLVKEEKSVIYDLSIARGFDYYTGSVYETRLKRFPEIAICSGGRYEDLASNFINKKLPGVGISIGVTRVFGKLFSANELQPLAQSPAVVLVVWIDDYQKKVAYQTASVLRSRGIRSEIYHSPDKLGKQITYADKKGIPYVWFPPFKDGEDPEVKNLKTGEQAKVEPENWNPES